MDKLPQLASVSDIRHRHLNVIERTKNGPVVIANRAQPVAVMVSPEEWNKIAEQLEDLDATVSALQAELEIERGEDEVVDADIEQLEKWAGRRAVPA